MANLLIKYPILTVVFQCSWILALLCISIDILQLFIYVSLADQISELIKFQSHADTSSSVNALLIILYSLLALTLKVSSAFFFYRLSINLRNKFFSSYLLGQSSNLEFNNFDIFLSINGYFDAYSDSIVRTSLGIWTNLFSILVLGAVVIKSLMALKVSLIVFVPLLIALIFLFLMRKFIKYLSEPIINLTSRRDHYLYLIQNNHPELLINAGIGKLIGMILNLHSLLYKRIATIKSIEALIPDLFKLFLILFVAIIFYQGTSNPDFLATIAKLLVIASVLQPAILSIVAISSKFTYLNSFVIKHSSII